MKTTHALLEITVTNDSECSGVLTVGDYYVHKFNTRELGAWEIARKFDTFPEPGQPWDISVSLKTVNEALDEGFSFLANQLYLTFKPHRVKTIVTINGNQPNPKNVEVTRTQIILKKGTLNQDDYNITVKTEGSTIGTKTRHLTKTELQNNYRHGVSKPNMLWSPIKPINGLPMALKCAWGIVFNNYKYNKEPFTVDQIITPVVNAP